MYGDGLFETIHVPAPGFGSVRWIERHLARLRLSGRSLGYPADIIEEGCEALTSIVADKIPGIWRVTISRPGVSEGCIMDWGGTGCVTVRHRPFSEPQRPKLGLAYGYYLPDDLLRIHKSTSYLRYVEARRNARLEGFDDSILVSANGLVGEATAANILVCLAGEIVTPSLHGIVSGVTRAGLLELASEYGKSIRERSVFVKELHVADEIVLVSAGIGVLSAASFMERTLGDSLGNEMNEWLTEVGLGR